jgi:class 3 adenylate cyclase
VTSESTLLLAFRDGLWDHAPVNRDQDELRPITALFADVVGSTGLGERLGPDEVKAVIGEAVNQMSAIAEGFGGFVQAYQGDGICVFFGVPAAHEDDPERAGRAALEILAAVRDYGGDVERAWEIEGFSVRVGINTGSAAVGVVGAGSPHPVALGDVTNTAARLQTAAEPGTALIGPATAHRLEAQFLLEPVGAIQLKGKAEAVEAFRIAGFRQSARLPDRAPLVGREAESSQMRDMLDQLVDGRGQILVMLGPAGIGKSRLIEELRAVPPSQVQWVSGRAPSYGATGYGLFVDALRRWLEVGAGDPDVLVRTRLRARAGPLLDERGLAGLAAVLGLSGEASAPARAALAAWVEALAAGEPCVLALDDMQWADPEAASLVEELCEMTERFPLLIVLGMRPDIDSTGWGLRVRVLSEYGHRSREIAVAPLTEAAASELAAVLSPSGQDDALREAVAEAEGNPLYLEELIRSAAEGGEDRRHRSWTLSVSAAGGLPSALEGVLIARLDRLPAAARQLAQAAAVLGRRFDVPVLEAMVGDDEFRGALNVLLRAEVIREVRRYPVFECAFTHGLLQEAALHTLPKSRRRDLYAAAAAAIESQPGEETCERLELLAECYARSDDLERALAGLDRAATIANQIGQSDRAGEIRRRAAKIADRLNRV